MEIGGSVDVWRRNAVQKELNSEGTLCGKVLSVKDGQQMRGEADGRTHDQDNHYPTCLSHPLPIDRHPYLPSQIWRKISAD